MSGESHNDSSIVVQRWLFLLRLPRGEASFASDYTGIQEIVSKEISFSEALSYDFGVRSPALAESKRYRLNQLFFFETGMQMCRGQAGDTEMEGRFSRPARHEKRRCVSEHQIS